MVLFLILGIAGIIDRDSAGLLILLEYLAQLVAGYIGGRFAGVRGVFHGSLAALTLHLFTTALAIIGGADFGLAVLVFSVVIAAVVGAAGGALSDRRRTT